MAEKQTRGNSPDASEEDRGANFCKALTTSTERRSCMYTREIKFSLVAGTRYSTVRETRKHLDKTEFSSGSANDIKSFAHWSFRAEA